MAFKVHSSEQHFVQVAQTHGQAMVVVDGRDLAMVTHGISMEAGVGCAPKVTIDLIGMPFSFTLAGAAVELRPILLDGMEIMVEKEGDCTRYTCRRERPTLPERAVSVDGDL